MTTLFYFIFLKSFRFSVYLEYGHESNEEIVKESGNRSRCNTVKIKGIYQYFQLFLTEKINLI